MWSTMMKMYKYEGGWPALYRGIIPTVAGVAPYVCFCVWDRLLSGLLTSTRSE